MMCAEYIQAGVRLGVVMEGRRGNTHPAADVSCPHCSEIVLSDKRVSVMEVISVIQRFVLYPAQKLRCLLGRVAYLSTIIGTYVLLLPCAIT